MCSYTELFHTILIMNLHHVPAAQTWREETNVLPGGGLRKDEVWLLVGFSALHFIQCLDTAGWVTVRTSGPWKTMPLIWRGSLSEQMEKENRGSGNPGSSGNCC